MSAGGGSPKIEKQTYFDVLSLLEENTSKRLNFETSLTLRH